MKLATGPATTLQGMYPHMWQMPSGRILVAGPYPNDSFFLGLTTGSLSYSFAQIPDPVQRYWGTGVLLPGQLNKAMLIGGADRLSDPNNPAAPTSRTARRPPRRSSTRTTRAPAGSPRAR